MVEIEIHAPAKVNLFLHITGKRDDGYHLLDSLVVFPQGIYDILQVAKTAGKENEITITGPFAQGLQENLNENLICKALRRFPGSLPSLALALKKNIPIGAGLGGGSSDAAAVFHALENITGISLPQAQRDAALLFLGADVPVCYYKATAQFQGIGEIIKPCRPLPSFYILLLWPGVPSYTRDVFSAYKSDYRVPFQTLPDFKTQSSLLAFLAETRNDLQDAAEETCPAIALARHAMEQQPGCALARMTGSGSCVFGLFTQQERCLDALKTLSAQNPAWWLQSGKF